MYSIGYMYVWRLHGLSLLVGGERPSVEVFTANVTVIFTIYAMHEY